MVNKIAGFSRLKGLFHSGVNFKNYGEIVDSAKNHIVGNLPKDMIVTIKQQHSNQIGLKIQEVKDGFSSASEILREYDSLHIENINNLKLSEKETEEIFKAKYYNNYKKISEFSESIQKYLLPKTEKLQEEASKALYSKMSTILPSNAKVKITHAGSGCFGNGFKVEFLDNNGNKLFQDRFLKVYKDNNMVGEDQIQIETLITNKILSMDDSKLIELACLEPTRVNAFRAHSVEQLNDFKNRIKRRRTSSLYLHGIAAEANSVTFLKRAVGHNLNKNNIINPDMFDIKSGYSLAPVSGDSVLQKITSNIDFARYGLKHGDVDSNIANTVAGRIVDFGGIQTNKIKLQDKTTLKYYKKIMNRVKDKERLELVERLKELVKNPKTPLRDKIQAAINLAESQINKSTEFNIANKSNIKNKPIMNPQVLDIASVENRKLKYKQLFEKVLANINKKTTIKFEKIKFENKIFKEKFITNFKNYKANKVLDEGLKRKNINFEYTLNKN